MGSAERRERERVGVRTAILDAARAIMSERGYDGLTMRGVADRIEYTAAAIYKHFKDREELVRELCAHDFYAFAQILRARPGVVALSDGGAKGDSKDPYARLRAIGRGYTEFAMRYPEQYRVMFMTQRPVDQDMIEKGNPEEDAYATVLQAVAAAQSQGCFSGLDPDLVAQTAWATMHGVVSIEIVHQCVKKKHIDFVPLEQRIETALDGIILGLEAVAQKSPRRDQPKAPPKAPSRARASRRAPRPKRR